jgi:pyruvate/2-oxoglutarate dehydrogenase complex dihydrolipoamide acyltransferase (E2) component
MHRAVRNFHLSPKRLAIVVENVPALGESITEGTISKWMKNVHDSIRSGDVVAIIETDKVTVDIKSTVSGVMIEQMAKDNVAVGQPLFKIDTGLRAIPLQSPVIAIPIVPAQNSSAPGLPLHIDFKVRVPLIKFRGKRSNIPNASHISTQNYAKPIASTKPGVKMAKEGKGVDFTTLKGGAWFGRPKLSVAEIEAIESGGATMYKL